MKLFAIPFTPASTLSEIAINGNQYPVAADGSLDLGDSPDCETLTAARLLGFVDSLPSPGTVLQNLLREAQS